MGRKGGGRDFEEARAEAARAGGLLESLSAVAGKSVAVVDRSIRCIFFHSEVLDLEGLDPIGVHLRDVIGEARYLPNEEHLKAALRGETREIFREIAHPDGGQHSVAVRFRPHRVGGAIAGAVMAAQDVTEARRAQLLVEAALSASEERFARLFRTNPGGLTIRRLRDGVMLEVNARFEEITGFRRDEVIGRTAIEVGLATPEMLRRRDETLDQSAGRVRTGEAPFMTRSGEERVALTSLEPIDLDGEPCMLASFIDITERKRAERRLGAQQAVSRVLADATTIDHAAPHLLRALCEAEGWAIGTLWEADRGRDRLRCVGVWHPRRGPELDALGAFTRTLVLARGAGAPGRVWQTGEPHVVRDVAKDASFARRKQCEAAGLTTAVLFPIKHGDDVLGVIDFIGTAEPTQEQLALLDDVTRRLAMFMEQSRAIASVRRSEARMSTVIEGLSEGLTMMAIDGRIVHSNQAMRRLHGETAADSFVDVLAEIPRFVELSDFEGNVLSPEDWPAARILRGETIQDHEYCVRRLDRDWHRVLSYSGSLVAQEDGSELAVVTVNDITDRVRRDELRRHSDQLAVENHRMRETNRLKSEFLANMSHELRTPLNAVIGFTKLMHDGKTGPVSAEQREYLGDVLSSAQHLLQLINDVLDLAKIDAGKITLVHQPRDLARVAKEVTDILRGLAAQKRLKLTVEIDPTLAEVVGDERSLKQILYNYVSNAIKFTPERGRVVVRARPAGAAAYRLEVEDTGVGIAPEDMRRLFVEFEQLEAGRADGVQGTGLGLALCRKLAEAYGGTAGCESVPGKGSTFYVELPRDPTRAR